MNGFVTLELEELARRLDALFDGDWSDHEGLWHELEKLGVDMHELFGDAVSPIPFSTTDTVKPARSELMFHQIEMYNGRIVVKFVDLNDDEQHEYKLFEQSGDKDALKAAAVGAVEAIFDIGKISTLRPEWEEARKRAYRQLYIPF